MSTQIAPRSYSTRELQAAAAALAAGRFTTTRWTSSPAQGRAPRGEEPTQTGTVDPDRRDPGTGPADAGDIRAHDHSPKIDPNNAQNIASASRAALGPLLRVRAANGGAGASTTALAIADAADEVGIRTRVLDAAAPAWSGLLGASAIEVGAAGGWRRGCRGNNVVIDRVEESVRVACEVPVPRPVVGIDLTVLDAGWSMRELTAAPMSWVSSTPARVEVLVTRPHGRALSQTEAALTVLEEHLAADQVIVVVVGATRWRVREFAAAGRLLCRAHEQDAVLFTPLLPAKALPALGPEPLPKHLVNPAHRLLERITTITGPLT